jgi:D-inositol-3-phosphate glycosyltransferase
MSVYIRELALELGKAGHFVDIFTCAGNGRSLTDLSDHVRLIRLPVEAGTDMTKISLFPHLPDAFGSLDDYAARETQRYDLIHSHYWLSAWVGHLARERWHIPHVITFHTTGLAKQVVCAGEREPEERMNSERRLAGLADRIVASTAREKDFLTRSFSLPPERIGIVPCGVNPEQFRPIDRALARGEAGFLDNNSIVLYVGRFAPVKGMDRLLTAMSHLRRRRGLRLVIAGGDGPESREAVEFRRLVKRFSIADIVLFRGRIDHDRLPPYYNSADVLVVPSYSESFGLVALESLACGTPVVATPVGAMDEIIREGCNGTVVNPPTPRALATAIERFIVPGGRDDASRERILASVLSYGWDRAAAAMVREYTAVLRSRTG